MLTPHQKFAQHVKDRMEADPRFLGLAAGGSWITGELDEFSDLDLVLVSAEFPAEERAGFVEGLAPLLAQFPGDHLNVPQLVIALFEDPLLHVDLKFVTPAEFSERIENPVVLWERDGALNRILEESKPRPLTLNLQWIEDRFWTWIHYSAQRLGRGEIFETLSALAFLREKALGPLVAARAGKPPRGVRRLERWASPEDLADLAASVATYDPRACERALKSAAKHYVGLREALAPPGLRRNRRAEMAALRYLHEVSERLG